MLDVLWCNDRKSGLRIEEFWNGLELTACNSSFLFGKGVWKETFRGPFLSRNSAPLTNQAVNRPVVMDSGLEQFRVLFRTQRKTFSMISLAYAVSLAYAAGAGES